MSSRRRGHVQHRSRSRKCSIWQSAPKQRSMPSRCAATTSRPRVPRGGVRHADAGPGDRRPSLLPARIEDLKRRLCTDRRRGSPASAPRLLSSGNQRRDGAWRRLVVQVARGQHHAAHRGLLRPDGPLNHFLSSSTPPPRLSMRFIREATTERRACGDDPAVARRAFTHLRHRHADDGGAARAVCEPLARHLHVRVAVGAVVSISN